MISVIIPAFNGADMTLQSVDAVVATTPPELLTEVIVVDDGSTDGAQAVLRRDERITLVERRDNGGFSVACNTGAGVARAELLFFLNNDAFARPGSLAALADAMRDPAVGIAGARLLYDDDTVQHAGVVKGRGTADTWEHVAQHIDGDESDAATSRDYAAVTGAALIVRRTLFDAAGGFDTGYCNGWEDIDLCMQAWRSGARVRYVADAVLTHLESATIPRARDISPNQRRFRERWGTRVASLRQYAPALPPSILVLVPPRPTPDEAAVIAHVRSWWGRHAGARVHVATPSPLARPRAEVVNVLTGWRPLLEVAIGSAVSAPRSRTRRVAYVAPADDEAAVRYARADADMWWAPTNATAARLRHAGIERGLLRTVRLGVDDRPAVAETGTLVTIDERSDPWAIGLCNAIAAGATVVGGPVDAVYRDSPGVVVVDGDREAALHEISRDRDALAARREAVQRDARRRLGAYRMTHRVRELGRRLFGATPPASAFEIDAGIAQQLRA